MNSKNKNIRDLYKGINEVRRDWGPINKRVENGNVLADSPNILNKGKKKKKVKLCLCLTN
jgi:hypothetical protein